MTVVKNWRAFLRPLDIFGFLLALFATFLLFPMCVEAHIFPLPEASNLWASLDQSWMLHLNYVQFHDYVWGKDVIFTYGPLSYLATKVGWGKEAWHFAAYDFFMALNLFLMFFLSFRESRQKFVTALLIAVICVVYPIWLGSGNAIVLMALLIFWIRRSLDKPIWWNYALQITLLILAFFIKFNTGLVAFPLFFAGIVYNIVANWKAWKRLIVPIVAAIVPIVVIPLLCTTFKVALSDYLSSGIEIISGYNEVMYLPHTFAAHLKAILIMALTVAILLYRMKKEGKPAFFKNLTTLFLYGSAIFVLYKQGFVRGMELDFFIFSILIVFAIPEMHGLKVGKLPILLTMAAAGIACVHVLTQPDGKPNLDIKTTKVYLTQYKLFTHESGMFIFPNDNALPKDVLEIIGQSTVDAFPWNTKQLLENKLNLSARPVFQAYTAYTKELEDLNFVHYNDMKTAPEFIIYDFATIDGRYAFFDEPKLNLAISRNYAFVKSFDFQGRKLALLQKRKDFKPIKLTRLQSYELPLSDGLQPHEGLFYEVKIQNNLLYKAVSVVDHAPALALEIFSKTYPNLSYQFRTSSKLLESGLFSTKYMTDTNGFQNFMEGKSVETVGRYEFKPENPLYFSDTMEITEYKISQ